MVYQKMLEFCTWFTKRVGILQRVFLKRSKYLTVCTNRDRNIAQGVPKAMGILHRVFLKRSKYLTECIKRDRNIAQGVPKEIGKFYRVYKKGRHTEKSVPKDRNIAQGFINRTLNDLNPTNINF